jgi:eukaryotic-like serine/threonine-protein kinase
VSVESVAGGRYRLRRRLGEGGMATVYLAHDAELDRPVAVKVLSDRLAGDREVRTRFLREGRLAARLAHPNVVAVYDAGEEAGRPYLVMEHVDGETLAELLRRSGPLPAEEAVRLVLQACAGLEHAHAAGLVHRDVKPQNLLVTDEGAVKVADFGIARAEGATQVTQAGTILGTAAYLAPEQATGEAVGPPADVYSLGAVLYELLAGRPPFEDETLDALLVRHRAGPAAPPAPLEGDVPPELEEVVMRTLARLPQYRPPSAAALARDLSAALGEQPAEEEPGTAATTEALVPPAVTEVIRRPRRSVGRVWGIAAVAAASLAAFVLALVLVRGTAGEESPPSAPAQVEPVPQADTPEDQARSLADWIRRHSG